MIKFSILRLSEVCASSFGSSIVFLLILTAFLQQVIGYVDVIPLLKKNCKLNYEIFHTKQDLH